MKTVSLILLLLSSFLINSQTIMSIHKSDGTIIEIPLSSIDSITYNTSNNNTGPIVSNAGSGVVFDGYNYPTIVIGNGQEWMSENLKTTHYANGESILDWINYNNDTTYDNTYGKLYNWYTTVDNRNVCPTGWHVPTTTEWDVMINYLGGETVAGGVLKETGTLHWQSPNSGATNGIGFNGLPAGYSYPAFTYMSQHSGFWTSSEDGVNAWARDIHFDSQSVTNGYCQKTDGLSIRCLKN